MSEQCKDDWHLSRKEMLKKYGEQEANKKYRFYRTFYRTCPSCGKKDK